MDKENRRIEIRKISKIKKYPFFSFFLSFYRMIFFFTRTIIINVDVKTCKNNNIHLSVQSVILIITTSLLKLLFSTFFYRVNIQLERSIKCQTFRLDKFKLIKIMKIIGGRMRGSRQRRREKKEVIMERRKRRRRDPIIENSSLSTMISLWIVSKAN